MQRDQGLRDAEPVGRLGTLLGTDIEPQLYDVTVELAVGDVLLLYTDGVTEVRRRRREVFGLQQLAELLRTWGEETSRAIFPRRRIGRLGAGWEASFLVFATDPTRSFDLPPITTRVKQGCVM